ncbi:hypothetical protein RB195_000454 [Necator americanus]|uniref:Hepatocyte growth factor-regulated tyrosine kinase substrate n=1 Tax=Necator americanus TaxID=51031 RepID=A0ABR1D9T4_NECAM
MSKKFDKLLEAATDSTNLEPNWDGIIACFDSIRAGEVPAKVAMQSIRKRIQHDNPHVVMHALLVLDACVKNCGHKIHAEVATREFMEEFKNLGIGSQYEDVKTKVLEMLQCWAMAFANKPEYKIVVDTHNLMKLAGFDFPSIKEADAMFTAQVAPDWHDGTECYRCRSEFSLFNRKHHCRACGQIFCDRCICDACYEKATTKANETKVVKSEPGTSVSANADITQAEKDKLLKEKEEEDLALALAISQSEAEAKEQERQKSLYAIYNGDTSSAAVINDAASLSSYNPSEMGYKGAAPSIAESPSDHLPADDPLARYLNRDYWQQRRAGATTKMEEWAGASASAPLPSETSIPPVNNTVANVQTELTQLSLNQSSPITDDIKVQTEGTMKWCQQLKEQVTAMENRIRSNNARGRSVLNDTAIQGLFSTLTEFHSQVLGALTKLEEERTYYESLQDHLGHISEARLAIDELRAEHKRRREERLAEEQRQRQAQMKQTLEMMRMKKHVMLMEQRNFALQRFQHQEMQARRSQMQPGVFYPNYGQQQTVSSQGSYPAYAIPGYQGFQQQQYSNPYPSYQQYPPNSAVAAPNQWQDAAAPAQQAQYLNSAVQAAPLVNGGVQQPSQLQHQPQPYYPPMQQAGPASYHQQPADVAAAASNGAPVLLNSTAQPSQIPQYPTAHHPHLLQNTVNGTEIPTVQQPEQNEQPLISFD